MPKASSAKVRKFIVLEVRINVGDTLMAQGVRAIIVPTMDVADWGEHQIPSMVRIAQFALLNLKSRRRIVSSY
jgi:hypothetical protein